MRRVRLRSSIIEQVSKPTISTGSYPTYSVSEPRAQTLFLLQPVSEPEKGPHPVVSPLVAQRASSVSLQAAPADHPVAPILLLTHVDATSASTPAATFSEHTGTVSALPYIPGVLLPKHTSYVPTPSPEFAAKMPAHPKLCHRPLLARPTSALVFLQVRVATRAPDEEHGHRGNSNETVCAPQQPQLV